MSTDDRTVTKKIINQMKEYNTYGRHLAFDCPTSISSSFNIAPWFPLRESPPSWSVGQVDVCILAKGWAQYHSYTNWNFPSALLASPPLSSSSSLATGRLQVPWPFPPFPGIYQPVPSFTFFPGENRYMVCCLSQPLATMILNLQSNPEPTAAACMSLTSCLLFPQKLFYFSNFPPKELF